MMFANSAGTPNVDATNNWWGTTVEDEIQGKIWDWNDDNSLGMVDYSPYLTGSYPPFRNIQGQINLEGQTKHGGVEIFLNGNSKLRPMLKGNLD